MRLALNFLRGTKLKKTMKRTSIQAICAAILALTWGYLPHTANADGHARLMTSEDAVAIKRVRDPRISPDGNWVAYSVGGSDLEEDEGFGNIYMTSADGSQTLKMTGDEYSASSPRWSPDGSQLAFTASIGKDAKTQVWTLDMRGGAPIQYSNVKQGVNGFAWSPDGSGMLLVVKDAKPEPAEGEDEDTPKPWIIDRLQFKQDYVGYLDRRRNHIYVMEGRMGEERQLTFGDYDDSSPVWSPDGTSIAFVSNRTEEPDANVNSDIWVVRADTDADMPAAQRVTSGPNQDYAPAWSSDGQWIVHNTVTDAAAIWYATQDLAVTPAMGGNTRVLTAEFDRNFGSPKFMTGDTAILASVEHSGTQNLARVDVATGAVGIVHGGDISLRGFDLHTSGAVAGVISRPDLPGEVFMIDGDDARPISSVNNELMASLDLANVREVQYASADGTEIEAFIYTPPGYKEGTKYPTLLWIHGGPVAQYDFGFSTNAQVFAAQGYVVVLPNPRGSSGYGQDFSAAIFADWGTLPTQDVMAGVDHAIELGLSDPDRLGVGGWSYGGILTNYVITSTDRFKGAMSGASEALYTSFYGHDVYQRIWEAELGLPWENQALWDKISPFYKIGNVTTPTMLMGGKEDWNVPIMGSEQLYQALKRLGVPTQLVVYPGEFHGFSRPSFIVDRYQRYLDWYGQYVKGPEKASGGHF